MRLLSSLAALAFAVLSVPACGSSGGDDPRCASLCAVKEPEIKGAGEVCSKESSAACVERCNERIADTNTICSECLLENARFSSGDEAIGGDLSCQAPSSCPNQGSECTTTGRAGECTYCEDDLAARDACEAKVNPVREVACEPHFAEVAKCANVCGSK